MILQRTLKVMDETSPCHFQSPHTCSQKSPEDEWLLFSSTFRASHEGHSLKVKLKVTQLSPTLCDPVDYTVHGNCPGQNTGVGNLSLLQGIFQTQGSNPGLLHCRQILYHLSHKGSPRILEWVAYPFFRGSSRPRNWIGVFCTAGRFFTKWAIKEAWWNLIKILEIRESSYLR